MLEQSRKLREERQLTKRRQQAAIQIQSTFRRAICLKKARITIHQAWLRNIKRNLSKKTNKSANIGNLSSELVLLLLGQFCFFCTTSKFEKYLSEWRLMRKLLTSSCNAANPEHSILARVAVASDAMSNGIWMVQMKKMCKLLLLALNRFVVYL